jgi:hypothetical protein
MDWARLYSPLVFDGCLAVVTAQAWGIVDEPCDPAIVAMIVPMAGLGQRQLEPVFCLGLQKIRFRLIASDLRCSR